MKHEMKTGSDHAESCSRRARARKTRNVGSSKSAKVGGVSVLDVDTWEVLSGGCTVDEQSTHCRAVRSLRPCAAVLLLLPPLPSGPPGCWKPRRALRARKKQTKYRTLYSFRPTNKCIYLICTHRVSLFVLFKKFT